jgi:transcriptional regulator with XRE-family HTH domain
MTGRHPFKKLTEDFSPDQQARVATRIAQLKGEMALSELRQARQQSQQDMARTLNVKQPAVAKLEKRADMYVSNLRRYVEALGGSLEITATFPEGRVNITNFSDLAAASGDDNS